MLFVQHPSTTYTDACAYEIKGMICFQNYPLVPAPERPKGISLYAEWSRFHAVSNTVLYYCMHSHRLIDPRLQPYRIQDRSQ